MSFSGVNKRLTIGWLGLGLTVLLAACGSAAGESQAGEGELAASASSNARAGAIDTRPDLNVDLCGDKPELDPIQPTGRPTDRIQFTLDYSFKGAKEQRQAILFVPQRAEKVPLVVFINGGSIDGDRYDWLGSMLSSNGFGAAIIQQDGNSGVDRMLWLDAVLARLSEEQFRSKVDLDKVILGGHSFGGLCVLCINSAESCPIPHVGGPMPSNVIGSFTLNSHMQPPNSPQFEDPVSIEKPVMMLLGTNDAYSRQTDVETTYGRLTGKGPFFLVSIAGANHFQSVDCLDATKDNYSKDGKANLSHREAADRIGKAVLTYVQWLTSGSSEKHEAMDALNQVPQVLVRSR